VLGAAAADQGGLILVAIRSTDGGGLGGGGGLMDSSSWKGRSMAVAATSAERGTGGTWRPAVVQWLRFATVGGSNTLLSWCLYAGLVRVGVHYLLASSVGFAVGALNSYALNRRWTFRSRGRRLPEALRFGVVQCVGLAVDVWLLYALVHGVGIYHLLAQALVFPAASALTFLLSRHWAFARGYGVSQRA
jgi:putative flippase GtrA